MMEAAKKFERTDNLEAAVDMALGACDGDVRDTLQALVVANSFLVQRVERLKSLISRGFIRGKLSLYDLP